MLGSGYGPGQGLLEEPYLSPQTGRCQRSITAEQREPGLDQWSRLRQDMDREEKWDVITLNLVSMTAVQGAARLLPC